MSDKAKDGSEFEDDGQLDESYDELDRGLNVNGSRRRNTREDSKDGGYQLKNVLKLPRATTYSTQAVYDQIHAGDIDLSPEYQRDTKQIGLIDSILRNFYIPPVIFVTHQYEDGSETKTCIDGKQRLTSIQRFMDGEIPHKDPQTGDKYFFKRSSAPQGKGSMVLPEKYKRIFVNKQIVCIEYQDLPGSDEREIFQRVQLGMALTPAEKLQVINSPMASFVRSIQTQYLESSGPLAGDELDWDRSRGGDFRCITQALYLISKYPRQASLASVLQLEKWLHNPTSQPARKGKEQGKGKEGKGDWWATTRSGPCSLRMIGVVAPIEFVMMCLLISVEKDKLPLREIAEGIGEMRVKTRAEHTDIRSNARVAKTMFDSIGGRCQVNGGTSGSKRKRGLSADEDDESQRKIKEQKPDAVAASTVRSPRVPPPPRLGFTGTFGLSVAPGPSSTASRISAPSSSTPSVIQPPRPMQADRLQAVRDAKSNAAELGVPPGSSGDYVTNPGQTPLSFIEPYLAKVSGGSVKFDPALISEGLYNTGTTQPHNISVKISPKNTKKRAVKVAHGTLWNAIVGCSLFQCCSSGYFVTIYPLVVAQRVVSHDDLLLSPLNVLVLCESET
ncbi:hypothetical protein F5J12DRAFT_970295 [Pisolithus orientalis]|uniref:uncharacterized protein n=1 Tax=Pisolithus orientalis TaxID=936130 RepID=UPI002224E740|nr:uncharacterized protein F5J12DRAFT_970295 [Pisolithus orientalis]KAI6015288.1 hypothetical protein F5J12DRAFT_970295 [Pisolithus orientalis]